VTGLSTPTIVSVASNTSGIGTTMNIPTSLVTGSSGQPIIRINSQPGSQQLKPGSIQVSQG